MNSLHKDGVIIYQITKGDKVIGNGSLPHIAEKLYMSVSNLYKLLNEGISVYDGYTVLPIGKIENQYIIQSRETNEVLCKGNRFVVANYLGYNFMYVIKLANNKRYSRKFIVSRDGYVIKDSTGKILDCEVTLK